MFKPAHKDFACILNMLDAIQKIETYTNSFKNADEFYEDTKSFDAVMMNFVVIGEMSEKLSDDLIKETQNEINWFKIKGFRNIIAHDYFGIDAEEIWQIIHGSLFELRSTLKAII